jgi:hypothetical protein
VDVREITTTSAGDKNFFANSVSVFNNRNTPATFAGLGGAEKASRSAAENDCVKGSRQTCLSRFPFLAVD